MKQKINTNSVHSVNLTYGTLVNTMEIIHKNGEKNYYYYNTAKELEQDYNEVEPLFAKNSDKPVHTDTPKAKPDYEYIIVGKVIADKNTTSEGRECLICLAGTTKEQAERALQKAKGDKNNSKYYDFCIEQVSSKECWWNYGTD